MAYDVINKKVVSGVWCCGIGDEVGIEVKLKDKADLLNKVDDLRYDVRKAGGLAGAGLAALAGAIAFLGLAEVFKVARTERK